MGNELDEHLECDREKIRNSIRLQMPIEITSYTLPKNMEAYISGVIDMFLEECHQEPLKEYIEFCVSELLANSKKANTKRIYFQELGLDINDPDDYEKGMISFKEETVTNIAHYLELQRKAGLYIKLILRIETDKIYIEIKNNCTLTVFEEERIQKKLDSAQKYDNMEEVLANVIDQSEGAGLGIIIIILMLHKVGLSKDNYQVFCTEKETVTRIILPCSEQIFAGVEILSYEFVYMQEQLPVIKENFEVARKIVSEEKINRNALLRFVRTDITLSMLLFILSLKKDKKCFNLPKVIELLSDDELRFVYSYKNPSCKFVDKTVELERLWEHAHCTAFYAYNLLKNRYDMPLNIDGINVDEEYFYLLGLFNSIGPALVATASEEQIENITELSKQFEGLSDQIIDIFCHGNARNYLNLVFTKKFGFPTAICKQLFGWNSIAVTQKKYVPIVEIFHLAEMMQYFDEQEIDFYQIEKNILRDFSIETEKQFSSIICQFKEVLKNQPIFV